MWNFAYSRIVVSTSIVHPCLQGVIISFGIFWCPSTSFCFISCLTLSVFLYLSSTFSDKLKYVLVSVSPLILFHVLGPHIGPSLAHRPAPAHLDFHDPLWLRLITLPPSNLVLMCINNSARLVVKLSAGVCVCVCWQKKLNFCQCNKCMLFFLTYQLVCFANWPNNQALNVIYQLGINNIWWLWSNRPNSLYPFLIDCILPELLFLSCNGSQYLLVTQL